MKKNSQSGLSILETAVILPVVLAFLLGSIDTANYFRSYNAVREGVNAGLRCLYPTDAGCVAIAAPQTVALNDQFIPPLYSHYYDYDGQEKKLLLPDYVYGPIAATTLQSVSYQIDRKKYVSGRSMYALNGTAKVMTVEYPSIKGSDNPRSARIGNQGLSVLDVTTEFGHPYVACDGLPSKGEVDEKSYREATEKYGRITFTVPDLPNGLVSDPDVLNISKCFANRDGKPLTGDSARSSCVASKVNAKARMFFKLEGKLITEPNRAGKSAQGAHLDLFIEYSADGRRWQDASEYTNNSGHVVTKQNIGGDEFNREDANFYPRGFNSGETKYKNNGDGEGLINYSSADADTNFEPHGALFAPWGSQVRITLRMRQPSQDPSKCPSGATVGWQFNPSLSVFKVGAPEIIKASVSCQEKRRLSQCKATNPTACTIAAQSGDRFIDAVRSPEVFGTVCDTNNPVNTVVVPDFGCADTPEQYGQRLASYVVSQRGNIDDYHTWIDTSITCNKDAASTCPPNFGVSDVATTNDHGLYRIINSAAANAVCPAQNSISGSEQWSETTKNIDYSAPITKRAADCSFDPNQPLPPELLPPEAFPYKKLVLPIASQSGSTQMDTASVDPVELKKLHQYACAAVTTENRSFSEQGRHDFTDTEWQKMLASDFYGPREQLGCGAAEKLKSEAKLIGLADKSFFEISKSSPTGTAEYKVSVVGVDSCTHVRTDQSLAATNLRVKAPGSPFDEGIIPPSCLIASSDGGTRNICISLPAGVRKVADSSKVSIDQNQAKSVAHQTIKSFLASAKVADPQCETEAKNACAGSTDPQCLPQHEGLCLKNIDPHCSHALAADCVAVNVDNPNGEAELLNKPFTMMASVQQPLLILGNKPVTVAYQGSRNWEGR